jgi:signal transduction histidine kinase
MYRIVQEALTNVRKHARASNVTVSLHQADAGYTALVTDDGVGFAPEVAEAPGHLGLASMRERAQVAGGWLRIDTAPGRGTTVEVWLPDVPDSDFGDFPLARSDDSAQDEEAA